MADKIIIDELKEENKQLRKQNEMLAKNNTENNGIKYQGLYQYTNMY